MSTQKPNQLDRELGQVHESAVEESDLTDERQRVAEELASLQARHQQVVEELKQKNGVLNQIQSSLGWQTLSVYYKLRGKLIPRRMARPLKEAITLLRDMRLVSASGLFDKAWYLRQNPDVAHAGVSPLRHYLRWGAFEGRDPNPLFDSDWYLKQYPDLAEARVNPLVHYLRHGASEGGNPSPHFDSCWYLEQYPTAVRAGMNPLVHYVLHGAAEGLLPSPDFDRNQVSLLAGCDFSVQARSSPTAGEHRPRLKTCPIPSPVNRGRPIISKDRRCLLCITHVLPYPPHAGNEYRIHRMLDWFAASDFEPFLVVCPLPGSPIPSQRLATACSAYSNLVVCERDGTVLYHLADGDAPVQGLNGVRPRDIDRLLAEKKDAAPIPQRLFPVVRTYCSDVMAEVLLHLDSVLQPEIILAEYIFMTRPFPLLRKEAFKVVDTHDVFSTKGRKVVEFGLEDSLAMNSREEASFLKKADLVIAIQSDEAEEVRHMVPNTPVVTVGIDFDPVETPVASDNALNAKGLSDFLRFAWPLVQHDVPGAELRIAGSVGRQLEVDDPGIKILGHVKDLSTAYAEARVVINPAVAGTGLKIKTIEALCSLRPLVTWPSGVDGIAADVRALCYIATDWYLFAQHVIHLCRSQDANQALVSQRDEILQRFSPDTVYAELKAALSGVHAGDS
jgi:glycosyl transferase family 1